MEISLTGIEEALSGLGYRETSPKARLIRAIHTYYKTSESPDEIRSIDSDELIDLMWDLGGERQAIRSKRKNLSSIKSSVNKDLDDAWEEGRNPDGITVGPLNTFVMSDAAKDKILNSFSGSMGPGGGKSIDQIAEALKIVSDYLSEMPADVEGEQLSNLKTLIEDLSENIREDGEAKVIEKIVYRNGEEEEDGEDVDVLESDVSEEADEDEFDEIIEEDVSDEDEIVEEASDELVEIEDTDDVEILDESDLVEEIEEIGDEIEDEDELEEVPEGEEEEGGAEGDGDTGLEIEDLDDVEILDEADLSEDVEEIEDEDELEEVPEGEADEAEGNGDAGLEIEDGDDVEILDEEDLAEEVEEIGDEIEGDEETEDDAGGEDEEGDLAGGEGGDENIVELLGAEGLEDADEVEIVYEDEPEDIEEIEEDAEIDEAADDEAGEAELVDEDDVAGEEAEDLDDIMEDVEVDDVDDAELDEAEFVDDEEGLVEEEIDDSDEEVDEVDVDEVEVDDADEVELVDEEDMVEVADDLEEVEADGDYEEVVEEEDDLEELPEDDGEEGPGEGADEDVVELEGAEGLEEADEVEFVDEDDLIEEAEDSLDDVEEIAEEDELDDDMEVVEEVEEDEEPEADETIPAEDALGNNIGLPIDQLMEDLQNFEEFQMDENQKRLLAEQFDGYLGAMERYYNQYIFVKKGNYRVGAEETEEDMLEEQQVLMADYYMGKYPITNALFEVFVERTGYKTTAEKTGYGYVYHGRFRKVVDPNTGAASSIWNSTCTREKVKGATWYQPLGPGSTLHNKRNHPVVQVSIKDARTFAAWTGKRLPSEIEWEAAARSQTGFKYPWGNEWLEGVCNFENSGISDTCPVDNFPHGANEAGIADLLGNVMEWTSDECEPKYPLETPSRFFIAKGGSWVSPEQTVLFGRSRLEADFTSNTLGFRCLAD